MKQIENNFVVSGFVGKDAEIRQFANASVARFSLAVSRQEKSGEETKRVPLSSTWKPGATTPTPIRLPKSPRVPCSQWRATSNPKNGLTRTA